VVIVVLLGTLYAGYSEVPALQRALTGLAAAAAGLIVGLAAKMAAPLIQPLRPGVVVALAAFVAAGVLRLPMLAVLAVLAPISLAVAWRWRR
jgi:chromate transporter